MLRMYEPDRYLTAFLGSMGVPAPGNINMLGKADQATSNWFRNIVQDANYFTVLSKGEAALVTKRNDVLLICPSSHNWYGDSDVQGAALTWDKQTTHMIGMAARTAGGGCRARFNHSGYSMANFMTVSGHNNLFDNLYWMHGSSTGGAADTNTMTITGSRNAFRYINFAGPMDATQAASANFNGVALSGGNNYFDHCMFGAANSIHRTGANTMLDLSGTVNRLNVFENCYFSSRSQATTPYFIQSAGNTGCTKAVFNHCVFFNNSTTTSSYDLAVAINVTSTDNISRLFFNNCTFAGVTNMVSSGEEAYVYMSHGQISYDTSAATPDRLIVGMAQNPAT